MRTRALLYGLMLSSGLGAFCGCASLMDASRQSWHQTKKALTPNTGDYRDPAAETEDQWSFVASDGRGHRPMESGGDVLYSSKAKMIERSLGVE